MPLSLPLTRHLTSPCAAVHALRANAVHASDGSLQLCFQLSADLNALSIPATLTQPAFQDGLWQHTCFEAFVAGEGSGYREFNFSPSGEWAAYAFVAYRERDTWQPVAAPSITLLQKANELTLNAHIPTALLTAISGPLQLGLSAVIEDRQGTLSYWALSHSGERPDFHQRSAFSLRLEPATDHP